MGECGRTTMNALCSVHANWIASSADGEGESSEADGLDGPDSLDAIVRAFYQGLEFMATSNGQF